MKEEYRPKDKLKDFIVKNVVPGAGDVLEELETKKDLINILCDELESYTDGRAYEKESGIPWRHRIENSMFLINKIRDMNN